MVDGFQRRFQMLKSWIDGALGAGWITLQDSRSLEEIEQQQAAALFAQSGRRPLIVAFFGGTGVGKSSLLNRLAGEDVARVGLRRPTSSEVTLYLHQDCQLGKLPSELPLGETRVAYHGDDGRRLVAWLDMPDFDSVEERHRDLVKLWLPYIDWLVYVVSPGRYLDDIGWRFLQQRGNRHSWLFIMNHWDQGSPEQVGHLRSRLQAEGFSDPVILCTSCNPAAPVAGDDFHLLEQTINRAIEEYGLELLQQLGTETRIEELYRLGGTLLEKMHGYPMAESAVAWRRLLAERLGEFEQELLNNGVLLAQGLPQPEGMSLPWRRPKETGDPPPTAPADLVGEIWSERMDTRIGDLASELENQLTAGGIPVAPFRGSLDQLRREGKDLFVRQAEGGLATALGRSDTDIKGRVYEIAGHLGWLLPTAAAAWAVYHAVAGFYLGTQGRGEFLGIDFAIHSGLLIGLSWLLPWLLQRKLKPSMADKVNRALRVAIRGGMQALEKQGSDAMHLAATDLREQISRLTSVQEALSRQRSTAAARQPIGRYSSG